MNVLCKTETNTAKYKSDPKPKPKPKPNPKPNPNPKPKPIGATLKPIGATGARRAKGRGHLQQQNL